MIANKVPNFSSLFPSVLLKISASIYTPTHLEHALHVHAKSFSAKINHKVAVEFLFPKMYYLIAFYQRIVEL